jgi:hypothetical protein
MELVVIVVLIVAVAAGSALIGFPLYYWVQDRRRRGQPVAVSGIAGVLIVGLLGVVAVWLFVLMRP